MQGAIWISALLLITQSGCGAADDLDDERGSGASCPDASSSAIELVTATGSIHGTLELPSGCGRPPVVLVHAGSGPTDRDGNGPSLRTDGYELVAEGLAARGIASVRYDKRGVGESAAAAPAREQDLTFEMYVEDAVAWVDMLAADARFEGVTVAGHSEGSLIGMLAAAKSPARGFVSLAGAGRPAAEVLREQLEQRLSGALLDDAEAILDHLEAGHLVSDVPKELEPIFRPSVQPYLISWFQYDPAQEIGALSIQAAIVQGTTDVQVSVQDAQRLAEAKPDADLVIVEGMNHVLKEATLSQASQMRTYTDPSLPVVPLVIDTISVHARDNP